MSGPNSGHQSSGLGIKYPGQMTEKQMADQIKKYDERNGGKRRGSGHSRTKKERAQAARADRDQS